MMRFAYLAWAGLVFYAKIDEQPDTPWSDRGLLIIGALLLLSEIAAWRNAYEERTNGK